MRNMYSANIRALSPEKKLFELLTEVGRWEKQTKKLQGTASVGQSVAQ